MWRRSKWTGVQLSAADELRYIKINLFTPLKCTIKTDKLSSAPSNTLEQVKHKCSLARMVFRSRNHSVQEHLIHVQVLRIITKQRGAPFHTLN